MRHHSRYVKYILLAIFYSSSSLASNIQTMADFLSKDEGKRRWQDLSSIKNLKIKQKKKDTEDGKEFHLIGYLKMKSLGDVYFIDFNGTKLYVNEVYLNVGKYIAAEDFELVLKSQLSSNYNIKVVRENCENNAVGDGNIVYEINEEGKPSLFINVLNDYGSIHRDEATFFDISTKNNIEQWSCL